jgi:predicted lipoprotein with Yx(FWY)xxD motif
MTTKGALVREAIRPILLLTVATAAAAAVAACGSSSSSDTTSSSASPGGGQQGAGVVLAAARSSDLGKTILVDKNGDTVYLFEKDDEPDESYCNGGCAKVWPPVTAAGKPQANGLDASKLGTLKRDDRTTQVTYAGHPLYTYEDDRKRGEAKGNGLKEFGAEWYALEPSGAKAEEGDES